VTSSAKTLIKNLKQLRLRHELTQEETAAKADMEYKYYQHIEAGRHTQVRLDTLDRLASAYGLSGWELIQPMKFPPLKKRKKTRKTVRR
jgi:transcriptional regulator with XRE-family HTH domain